MPSTSLRGIMMSSTAASPSSRMLSSIFWCFFGIRAPASVTTVLSSSWLSAWPAVCSGVTPMTLSMVLAMMLTIQTRG